MCLRTFWQVPARVRKRSYLWQRWAPFRRHTNTGSWRATGTWKSSTWSWSIWEESRRRPSCRMTRNAVTCYWYLKRIRGCHFCFQAKYNNIAISVSLNFLIHRAGGGGGCGYESKQHASKELYESTNLDCRFLFTSSAAKMCTVPWSLDTQMRDASWLKFMLQKEWEENINRNRSAANKDMEKARLQNRQTWLDQYIFF